MFEAILIAIIEGFTEFIPVSSTGHVIVAGWLLDFSSVPNFVYEIVIQLGAILAVCVLYRKKLISTLLGLPRDKKAQHFALSVAIAFLPAAVLGALFHAQIKAVLFNPTIVASMLIIGGLIILWIERLPLKARTTSIDAVTLPTALKIGVCQSLAMIPGTSRSGATIMGSLLLGLDRKTATEFSFFLAIPTMLGAVVYDLYKHAHLLETEHMRLLAVGFVVAFITALFVVRHVISFISKHGFIPFAYYRIILGVTILLLLAKGV